jgi:hypothetical protein
MPSPAGQTTRWYGAGGRAMESSLHMQVPPDLASRLASVAVLSGRSPEAFLREAINRLIDSTAPPLAPLEDGPQHTGFVPQPQSFSVYE